VKKLWLTGVAFTVLIAGSAMAADMPVKAYRAPPPVYFSWTGLYIGVNAGGAFAKVSADQSIFQPQCDGPICPEGAALIAASAQSPRPRGFTGGAQAGYNLQFNNWVFGLETDVNYASLGRSFGFGPVLVAPGFPKQTLGVGSTSESLLATVRGRLGVAFDRLLAYATGGIAFTNERYEETIAVTTAIQAAPIGLFNLSTSRNTGWVVGGGVEYAATTWWRVKVEYLHMDFGSATATAFNAGVGTTGGMTGSSMALSTRLTVDVVRAGVNYAF